MLLLPIGHPPGKIGEILAFFGFFRSMEKMAWDGPKWGREDFFPTNPGLANILGRTDLDFENFYFFHFLDPKFLDFQVPRFPKSGLGRAGLGPWAGRALGWDGLGPQMLHAAWQHTTTRDKINLMKSQI